jgi:hypothetical protein
MNPISALALTGALVVVGKWGKGQKLDIRMAVGFAVLLVMFTIGEDINPQLTRGFAVLVLLTALLVYGPGVVKALGFSK